MNSSLTDILALLKANNKLMSSQRQLDAQQKIGHNKAILQIEKFLSNKKESWPN